MIAPSLMTDSELDNAWSLYADYLNRQAERGYRLCGECQQWYAVRHMRAYGDLWLCHCCAEQAAAAGLIELSEVPAYAEIPEVARICSYCGDAHDSLTRLDGVECCGNCKQIALAASHPCVGCGEEIGPGYMRCDACECSADNLN